jgi:hypothetical protein
LIRHAPSLGGVDSLVSEPRFTSHTHLSTEERADRGLPDGFLRLSVGIEDAGRPHRRHRACAALMTDPICSRTERKRAPARRPTAERARRRPDAPELRRILITTTLGVVVLRRVPVDGPRRW